MSLSQFDERQPRKQAATADSGAANLDLDAIRGQVPDVDSLVDELEAMAQDAEQTREQTTCSCFLSGLRDTPCDAPRRSSSRLSP